MNKRIWLSSPHMSDEGYEQQYIKEAFDTNWIAPLGPQVDAFEAEMAAYAGVRGGAALSSGTAALHLALKLCGVKRGDLVFCSSFTFSASANPIAYEGGLPVFIDSEPQSWNMSPQALRRAFEYYEAVEKRRPAAVIVVNLYGQSADMDEIIAICDAYGVPVIEDAAESLGATYKGRKCGSFGKYSVFSFNGNKIITTSGGGMLMSNDLEALTKARFWATQAREGAPWYQHNEIGYNYRMSGIVAAIGRGQMRVLAQRIVARRAVFQRYYEAIGNIEGIEFMPEAGYGASNRWLTTMTIDDKKTGIDYLTLMNKLAEKNIETRPLWKPLHLQPVFAGCGYFAHENGRDVCAELFAKGLCLPSASKMSYDDQTFVIENVLKLLSSKK